jgi:UDP-glucose 4-epimerase
MAVLVTGGAGYIGSHTVRALLEQERAVVVLDSLATGNQEAVLGAPLVVGDIADVDLVQKVVSDHGVDSIIHFAGYKNAGESMQDPGKYFPNNVVGTARLLGHRGHGGEPLRLLRVVPPRHAGALPVSEDAPLAPRAPRAEQAHG